MIRSMTARLPLFAFGIAALTAACVDDPTTDPPMTTQETGRRLLDPADRGTVALGTEAGWTFAVDKADDTLAACNGATWLQLDPRHPTALPTSSLVEAGMPASLAYSWQGYACRAACWGVAGAGCAFVAGACAFGDVVSVGGFLIPCSVVTVAACGAAGADASICSDWCTQQYG